MERLLVDGPSEARQGFLERLGAGAEERLHEIADTLRWKEAATVCVILASEGYPGAYPKGLPISGLDALPEGVVAFHAGTAESAEGIVTNGGRVLGITASAEDMATARALAYAGVENINFEGMQFRTDIGWDNG